MATVRGPVGRLLLAAMMAGAVLSPRAFAEDVLSVAMDQARMLRVPERVATIVVGNPLIADASMQAGNVLVVTGKGYGVTNLAVLDRTGAVLMERMIQVSAPPDAALVVYRGVERETYSCTPFCERRVVIGDSRTYFDPNLAQIGARGGQALAASNASR